MYAALETPRALDHEFRPVAYDMPDPLDPDARGDLPLIVTRRRLIRLALVAAETGARFQRECLDADPVAWLLAPREVFDGRDAIEAALGLEGCVRAILLHGLGIGMDADPAVIDSLLDGDEATTGPSPLMV